uniref:Uncharacterized protein n=1 Tax=Rhizophora mucronata TaxID=61149 RepID=A0A2P2PUH2_RHIMU
MLLNLGICQHYVVCLSCKSERMYKIFGVPNYCCEMLLSAESLTLAECFLDVGLLVCCVSTSEITKP